jgi:integrase
MAILAECPICHKKQATKNKKCSCGMALDEAKKKKKVRYWISYRMPDGQQRRESVGALEGLDPYSITDAKDALAKRQVQKRERRVLEFLPESVMTFNELADWFLSLEKIKGLAYHKTLQTILGKFNQDFGNVIVGQIKPVDLENYQIKQKKAGYSESYIDQQIEAAKNMVTKAFDNDMIGGDCLKPFRKVKKLLKKGANARDRVLSNDEYNKLRINLPQHSIGPVTIAYWTGMRSREILKLTWDKVDLVNRVIKLEPTDTKEEMPKRIPISKPLRATLMQIPERGRQGLVFTYAGKRVKDIRDGLKGGCQKSDIVYGRFEKNGFIFHDLRHTFTTNARRAGVHRNVAMAIMGHSAGDDMNFRYDTIDDSDLLSAIDQIEAYLENVDHSVDQGANLEGSNNTSN